MPNEIIIGVILWVILVVINGYKGFYSFGVVKVGRSIFWPLGAFFGGGCD